VLSPGSECHPFSQRGDKFDGCYGSRVSRRIGRVWRLGVQGSSGTSAWFRSALIHATVFSQVLKVTLLVSGPLRLAISGGEGEGASAFAMSQSFFL